MKLVYALAALALSWSDFAAAQYAATVLADAPVAYYRFEETSGTTAVDSSGNGNDGTYRNGPTLNQIGLPALGRAVRFDGVDDYVDTPRSVAGNFTLEMWISTASDCPAGGQAFEGDGLLWSDVGGNGDDFVLACLDTTLTTASWFTGNPDTSVNGTTAIDDARWHHVVATRTQGGTKELYIDGVLQATGTTNANLLTANSIIAIAGNILDGRYFTGLVDEVAYYPTVLSPARIQAHFAAGQAPAAPIPATNAWTLAALAGALALLAFLALRRRGLGRA